MTPNGEHLNNGPIHFCDSIKILTPRHLCETPYICTSVLGKWACVRLGVVGLYPGLGPPGLRWIHLASFASAHSEPRTR